MKMNKKAITSNELMSDMSDHQLSRWIALFEAINIIADEAEKTGTSIKFTNLKQPALEHYVDSTSILVYRELTGKEM